LKQDIGAQKRREKRDVDRKNEISNAHRCISSLPQSACCVIFLLVRIGDNAEIIALAAARTITIRSKRAIKISPPVIVGKITISLDVAIVVEATLHVEEAKAKDVLEADAGAPEKSTGLPYVHISILKSRRE
jgi:hypothetical protein